LCRTCGTLLLKAKPMQNGRLTAMRPTTMTHFDTPFYRRFRRAVDWCVQHGRWITIGADAADLMRWCIDGAWARCNSSIFPASSRPEDPGGLVVARGHFVRRQ
jgi:multidrug efflux pump